MINYFTIRRACLSYILLGGLTGILLCTSLVDSVAFEPIRIGEVTSLTGPLAPHGTAIHQGILYAVEEVNAPGGLQGRRVLLLSRDDEGKPERAIAFAEELIGRQRVVATVGGYADSLVGPVSTVAERYQIPFVAAASLDQRLTQQGYRYFFRVSSLKGYLDATVGFVLQAAKARRVAILFSTTPGASQLADLQRKALDAAGVEVVLFEGFTTGLADFSALLAWLEKARAELVISNTFFADHILMVRQLRLRRSPIHGFLGTFGMEFPQLMQDLGPLSEHLLGTTGWEPGITLPGTEKKSAAFVKGFSTRFGYEPAPLAMHGYAAARAVLAAIAEVLAKGGPLTGERIREALTRIDLLLPLERLRFDPTGDPMDYQRLVIQIRRGRHLVVYPPERATGSLIYPMPPWEEQR